MQMFIKYLKLLIFEWYFRLGFILGLLEICLMHFSAKWPPDFLDIPSEVVPWLTILFFLYAGYKVWGDTQRKINSPKIIIDHEFIGNIIYLEVKNIGNDYARNIKIMFDPNIEHDLGGGTKRINDLDFFKNMRQIPPNETVRFLFGSFFDKKYLQKINVKMSYHDLEGRRIEDDQILEFKSFIGSSVPKKENEGIVKELQNISKGMKEQSVHLKGFGELLKEGVSIRNIDLQDYSIEDLSHLLKNIINVGTDEDMYLYPYINDVRQIMKCLRNKILVKKDLTSDDKKILGQLNVVRKHHLYLGKDDEFKNEMDKLRALL